MDFKALPKVELHVHLDCSLSYRAVEKMAPTTSFSGYRKLFVAPTSCSDLNAYISYAQPAIELMQTKANLRIAAHDLVEQFREDRVVYGEIRFAPLEHCRGGLSDYEVVKVVEGALEEASKDQGIEAFLILCSLRPYRKADSLRVAELAEEFRGSRVVGIDLAGDELQAADTHREAFEYAIGNEIKRTCHAGEARGSESVDEVLKLFQPHRIGHGVRAVENPATVKRLLDENIHLEICPTSNLLTGIFDKMESHSIRQLHETGVSLGINTDGRAISDVNLTDEMNKLRSAIGFSKSDFHCFSQSAIEHAFAPREIIRSVAADLQTEWKGKS